MSEVAQAEKFDGAGDDVRPSDLEPRFVCAASGRRGADIRPDWLADAAPLPRLRTERMGGRKAVVKRMMRRQAVMAKGMMRRQVAQGMMGRLMRGPRRRGLLRDGVTGED